MCNGLVPFILVCVTPGIVHVTVHRGWRAGHFVCLICYTAIKKLVLGARSLGELM